MARKIVVIFGLVVAALPYIGLPEAVDTTLYTLLGLLITFLAWSGKRPTSKGGIEEMEEELRTDLHPGTSPLSREDVGSQTGNILARSNVEDKAVAVSFERKRERNLKKRITQEPT